MAREDKEWIRDARRNDQAALSYGIRHLFNCREVQVDRYGDVLISDPQRRHWLDDEGLGRIARALKAGDI